MGYKFLEHTADLKIIVEENSLERAFKTSVMALKEVIAENIRVRTTLKKTISVEGEDLSDLLYKFIEEFLFLLDSEDFLVSKIEKLEIRENEKGYALTTNVSGDKSSRYNFSNSVKAITFNDMFVKEEKGKFRIQFVLDV